jgi:transglutaminase-like putative cysteine protease
MSMKYQILKFKIKLILIATLILLPFTFFLFPSAARADDAFAVDANVTYKVDDSGQTQVTQNISLQNLYSTLYATTYTLSLENINAQNITATGDDRKNINVDTQQNGSQLDIKLEFPDAVVGKGSTRHFTISYTDGSFATKTGEVWEISIPRLSDQSDFRSYQVNLVVPDSFGQQAYISPQPGTSSDSGGFKSYTFPENSMNETGVTAGFGQFQVFSFNLSYHLENPLEINSQTEIAIPPDTAFQKVYFSKIDPKPDNIQIDEDGNWLAVYKLTPRERIDVNVIGSVQIFASYRPFPQPSDLVLNDDLQSTEYWQSDNNQIKALAATLKTPEAIYDYVSTNLKYDTARVQPNVQRMGAINALNNPTQAICMEFTDLFIAIARAAGIPAREINGYAYTDNPSLQPLSLVNDVLHAWPEFYDAGKGAWIPVDPTWGATSGEDYFNKLDLRHFAFVIHGKSDTEPYPPGSYKLGTNPQKDVYVSFGTLPQNQNSIPQISVVTERNVPFFDTIYQAKVYNPGPASLNVFYPTVYFDNVEHSRDFVQILPPYASYDFRITVPFSLLGKNTPDDIKIVVNESQLNIPTNKSQVVVNSLLVLFMVFIIIVLLIMIRLKKLNLNKITGTITRLYAKITRKSAKNNNPTDRGATS